MSDAEEMRLTPGAEKVINLATDEARRMNYYSVGTEHLLLGLVHEGEGIAAGILQGLGVTLDKVRIQTFDALSQSSPGTGSSGVFAPPSVDPVAKQGKARRIL
jgi:ATP-dependent Clp protease ATP-binding subunit ClpC